MKHQKNRQIQGGGGRRYYDTNSSTIESPLPRQHTSFPPNLEGNRSSGSSGHRFREGLQGPSVAPGHGLGVSRRTWHGRRGGEDSLGHTRVLDYCIIDYCIKRSKSGQGIGLLDQSHNINNQFDQS